VSEERVPLSRPDISRGDIAAVVKVLRSPRLSLGPKLDEFEQAFARYLGMKHAVAVNSGTSALHLVVRAAGLGPGQEMITSPFTFVATSNCALFVWVGALFLALVVGARGRSSSISTRIHGTWTWQRWRRRSRSGRAC
jgi:perosamine synthetase